MEKIQVPARLLSHEEQNMESGRSYFNPQSLQATLNFEDWPGSLWRTEELALVAVCFFSTFNLLIPISESGGGCTAVQHRWWTSRNDSGVAFPCLDPAIAPGTSLLVNDIEVRPVPAGLAGFLVVHDFEWCWKALGTKRRWQWGQRSKLASNAARASSLKLSICWADGLPPPVVMGCSVAGGHGRGRRSFLAFSPSSRSHFFWHWGICIGKLRFH